MQNKAKVFLSITIVMLLSGCSLSRDYNDNPLLDETIAVDAVAKAKSIDKEKFIDYHVVNQPSNSKELIAVVFNTDNKMHMGFIDEYGNVIKEPFLEANNYDYYETLRGKIGVSSYFDKYYSYYEYYSGGNETIYYDRNFDKVSLSLNEQEEYESNKYEGQNQTTEIDDNEFVDIKEHLDKILKKGYRTQVNNIVHAGDIYDIDFGHD